MDSSELKRDDGLTEIGVIIVAVVVAVAVVIIILAVTGKF
jgi:hypothetical protein